jgi:glycine cleavage system H lipoate-binding protein
MITGFGSVASAVEAMKFGALDYVQKPFTEDELVGFTKKCLIRRHDRIEKQIKPVVRVVTTERPHEHEFVLPGGVFISSGHVWANVTVPGLVRVGVDDFARKMIGRIDAIEFPEQGHQVKKGEPLFYLQQGGRKATFKSPITGKVHLVNAELAHNPSWLEKQPYDKGWICSLKPLNLADELEQLKIGEKAAAWYRQEIQRVRQLLVSHDGNGHAQELAEIGQLVEGQLEETDERTWTRFAETFL